MPGKRIPKEVRDQAIKRVEKGESRTKVAMDLGINKSSVARMTIHLTKKLYRVTPSQKSQFFERVRSGEIPSVVAREIGVSKQSAFKWSKKQDQLPTPSDETKQKVLNALAEGKKPPSIAKEFKIPVMMVRDWRQSLNGRSVRRAYTDEEKQQAIKLVESGLTYAAASRLGKVGNQGSVKEWHLAAIKDGASKPFEARKPKSEDKSFDWITREYPHLEDWRESMAEWLQGESRGIASRVQSLAIFLERYLDALKLPTTRAEFLKRGVLLPDFFRIVCSQSSGGVAQNNHIHNFLDWVLLRYFSDDSDNTPMVSPAFCNPVPFLSGVGFPTPTESVREVLPYGFIVQLRELLASGPNFKDWTLAQSMKGKISIDGSNAGSDWFQVTADRIDKNDPDCVWRVRNIERNRSQVLEMWSPVRWVAILVKLQMTARTGQVRMADSGESDTWRFVAGRFRPNTGTLAHKDKRKSWAQGVFRRVVTLDGAETAVLYFNSNKTSDIGKDGVDKGQECPWPHLPGSSDDPYYWLEKLRNWQEKYNPINRRVRWAEIPVTRNLTAKSDLQNAGYPDTCFLFRTPEVPDEEHLPVSNNVVDNAWQHLMAAFERDFSHKKVTHENGSRIVLMNPETGRTRYPLHGNRVSLITAFIIDGGIEPALMMKIVGHCRLIMTLYYTKPGYTHLQNALKGAAEKLDAKKEETIIHWLTNAKADDMLKRVAFNADEWQTVIEINPALRNPVGWYLMHDGICLAGGNTTQTEDTKVRGCHNGGPSINVSKQQYGPVPGGIMNCSMCRWKAAEKHHGPALVATLNNQFYHLHLKQVEAVKHASTVSDLKKQKARDETSGMPFGKMKDLKTAERLYEMTMERLAILASSIGGTTKMIQRVQALPDDAGNGMVLAAAGDLMTMNTVLEEIDSELLQLAGVCSDVEVYPDLSPGKAIFRRSQLLDASLMNHSLPPAFAQLSEENQLIYGNAFMCNLAHQADPQNPVLGLRTVVSIIDQGKSLEQLLGVNLANLLPNAQGQTAKVIPIRLKIKNDNGKDRRTS